MLDVGTEPLGLFLGVMDLEPGHAEFGFGVVSVGGGELTGSTESSMNGYGLAVFVKNLDELLGATNPNLLVHIDERNRIEVFVHLDVAIGVNLGVAPLAELEACGGKIPESRLLLFETPRKTALSSARE